MANVYAVKTGNWSDTTVWNTGSLPTPADDVWSNNFIVTIDIDTQVLTIRNAATTGINAGGYFIINDTVSLSATVIAGTVSCLRFQASDPGQCTITGNVSGSTTTGINAVLNESTGTINLIGSARGGTVASAYGIRNNSTGTVNVTGNLLGNSGSVSAGYYATTNAVLNVLGNVTAGTGTQSSGIYIAGTSTTHVTNVTGNVLGGSGTGGSTTYNGPAGMHVFSGDCTVYGNISGGPVGTNWSLGLNYGNNGSGSGVVTVYGNIYGGGGTNAMGIASTSNQGTVTVYGNVYAGAGSSSDGFRKQNSGDCFVYGDVFGGSGSTADGVYNSSSGGGMYVFGTATGGTGSDADGAYNASTGILYVKKAVGNDFGLGSTTTNRNVGAQNNSQNGRMYVEQVEFGPRGQTPITGPVYILPSNRNTLTGRLTALGDTVTFYNSLSVEGLLPPVSSVQAGVVYNVGNSTGTMAVPSASAVQFGVPVDNTVGTAALTPQSVWGYSRLSATEVDSMGDRLRNTATTQSVGYQIASFNL